MCWQARGCGCAQWRGGAWRCHWMRCGWGGRVRRETYARTDVPWRQHLGPSALTTWLTIQHGILEAHPARLSTAQHSKVTCSRAAFSSPRRERRLGAGALRSAASAAARRPAAGLRRAARPAGPPQWRITATRTRAAATGRSRRVQHGGRRRRGRGGSHWRGRLASGAHGCDVWPHGLGQRRGTWRWGSVTGGQAGGQQRPAVLAVACVCGAQRAERQEAPLTRAPGFALLSGSSVVAGHGGTHCHCAITHKAQAWGPKP
jgi:hypothetical protein